MDLILLLDYPPVTLDDAYKEALEQTENFKKYAQTEDMITNQMKKQSKEGR